MSGSFLLERWEQVLQWLGTKPIPCRVCGADAAGSGRPDVLRHSVLDQLLCPACFTRIPWIHEVQCERCGRGECCPDCARAGVTFHYHRNRGAVRYDGEMKEWLGLYKYRGMERLEPVFYGMLHHAYHLLLEAMEREGAAVSKPVLTFVPVSEERLQERGFNQAERMAAGLGKSMKMDVFPLIKRVRHTDKQSMKSRGDRLRDMELAFAMDSEGARQFQAMVRSRLMTSQSASRNRVKELHQLIPPIILIDDVYTTGSTMQQCAGLLRSQLGVDVYGLTWAR
ncbi:ComF family protein [Paenibacillus turpanensis]|uniref:ComF family protein n=1 Tax=Paenibacillus turpanensis TaxID=2689078 RepID=UPI00140AFEFB|nr:ComF family protein [Paenibacillus turpanensis]